MTRGRPTVPPENGGAAGFEGCDCCVWDDEIFVYERGGGGERFVCSS